MLKSAPLLWFTISAIDAASVESASKESSVQSTSVHESRRMTRRLNIFESFAKSEDQRDEDSQLLEETVNPDDQTVNEILQQSLVELTEIIESSHLHFVFQSLLKMLSNCAPEQSDTPLPPLPYAWQHYMRECIRNLKYSVKDLRHRFGANFKFDHQGHLKVINLFQTGSPRKHFNLLMIPNTVEEMKMRHCQIHTISDWADLKGKAVKSLCILEGKHLKLNLDGLQGTFNHLPLEHLIVGSCQISEYFGVRNNPSPYPATFKRIGEWMKTSTLLSLRVECQTKNKRSFIYYRDGTWMFEAGN